MSKVSPEELTPNPGSDEAIAQGCLCPILDNGHGNDELGKTRGFWIVSDCPLHNHTPEKLPSEGGSKLVGDDDVKA